MAKNRVVRGRYGLLDLVEIYVWNLEIQRSIDIYWLQPLTGNAENKQAVKLRDREASA